MSSRELSPEWVLSSFISPLAGSHDEISELVVVARRLWPRIQAHARREQPGKSSEEALALATDALRRRRIPLNGDRAVVSAFDSSDSEGGRYLLETGGLKAVKRVHAPWLQETGWTVRELDPVSLKTLVRVRWRR